MSDETEIAPTQLQVPPRRASLLLFMYSCRSGVGKRAIVRPTSARRATGEWRGGERDDGVLPSIAFWKIRGDN